MIPAFLALTVAGGWPPVPLGLDPTVPSPGDNPLTRDKARLGQQLFFDPILSGDGTIACADCHKPRLAFTDGKPHAVGINGRVGTRNTPTVLNRAYGELQFWDGRAPSLEAQVIQPILNPAEMGNDAEGLLSALNSRPSYRDWFRRVFGGDATETTVARALASYVRTLLSGDSPYDRFRAGDTDALSPAAKRGATLFFDRFACDRCHSGSNFTDEKLEPRCYPRVDVRTRGYAESAAHERRYKTPTLRNVALTGPYLHNGSLATLDDVLEFYQRTVTPGRDAPFVFSAGDKRDLIAFLESLTGDAVAYTEPR